MSWSSRKKKEGIFLYRLFCPKGIFLYLCFISMYSVLNTLSEYIYFYISKNITSYTFFFVIVESLHCIYKRIIAAFIFNIQFISFSLYFFFNFKLFLICFLQLFFIKRFNNFFSSVKITKNVCPWHNVFNFFNHKNYFRLICNIGFCKNVFMF